MTKTSFIMCFFCTSVLFYSFSQSKKEQIEILTNRVDSLYRVLGEERSSNLYKLNELNSVITKLERQIADLTGNLTKLTAELQDSKDDNLRRQKEIVAKQQEIDDKEKSLTSKTFEISVIETQLKEKMDTLSMVRSELEKLKSAPKPLVTNNSTSNKETPNGSYKSVKIGTQTWMTENLNVSTFRNGDLIPEAKTTEEWKKAGDYKQPAWCYYDNVPTNGVKYGKLYNYYAATDSRGLVPAGYHIPSNDEWTILIDYLGDVSIAGGKMKSTGTQYWQSPNLDASNESGFSGLPGGLRNHIGTFEYICSIGYWWSSTEDGAFSAWNRYLYYGTGDIGRDYNNSKGDGFSVRCLRD